MLQNWIVGFLVSVAALYSLWYVLPASLRQRLGRLHSALDRSPSCSTSCATCGKCSGTDASGAAASCKPPPAEPAQKHPITFHRKP
ncbi:hypothetical protein BLL52_2672 [Rhodoferax antarcticus ANT.BR]|uniref:Uncharacterized protein n=1 Tax=Rhodoferax antarcticus ANT.BR TaxID=1111071 RepID=A0A1Q8YEI3_9BURK|nr:hypothetical protein RA876_07450 [Rhodoferax antarcticus]OLP06436.1 hypothetical protein BLL52_2672 [Rhodoferax antarcticus ANT.BR]